jgi:hypothetical protein
VPCDVCVCVSLSPSLCGVRPYSAPVARQACWRQEWHIHLCMYKRMYVCMYVCMYVYIYIICIYT